MNRTEETTVKLQKVRDWMAQTGLDGVVLDSQVNFAWITAGGHNHVAISGEAGVCSVVITAGGATVVSPNIEGRRLTDEELPRGCFEVAEFPWHRPERKAEIVRELVGNDRVAGDLPGTGREPAAGVMELRRLLLSAEVERYRELAHDAASIVESACRTAVPHESELDMAARVAASCYEKNMLPVVNLVAADERIESYRHPIPTANRVDRTMLVALTARRHGLHASVTRTLCFGEPAEQQERRHQACARIDACMILASRPGARLAEIFAAGVDRYAAEGFAGEWKLHHQGGLTGYAGREIKGTPATDYVLQENQALAWNPSITGAKSEDTILTTGREAEVLTSTGHWPTVEVVLESGGLSRPGLLIR